MKWKYARRYHVPYVCLPRIMHENILDAKKKTVVQRSDVVVILLVLMPHMQPIFKIILLRPIIFLSLSFCSLLFPSKMMVIMVMRPIDGKGMEARSYFICQYVHRHSH